MHKEAYRIISRHLAENMHVAVEFKAKACPSTDGKNIILPSELSEHAINALLGALLHETAHIKHSRKPTETAQAHSLSDVEMTCLNCLEDVRIDSCTDEKYPNALQFRQALIKNALKTKKAVLRKEELWIKIIKHICLKANQFDDSKLYDEDVLKKAQKFEKYIDIARATESTDKLVPIARKLVSELAIENTACEKEKQEAIAKASSQSIQASAEKEKAEAEYEKLSKLASDKYQESRSARNGRRRIENNLDKMISDKDYNQHSAEEIKALEEKIAKQKDKLKEKANAEFNLHNEYDNACEDSNQAYQKAREAIKKAYELREIMQEEICACFTKGKSEITLTGFSAFNEKDFAEDNLHVENINLLEELISEALIFKKDKAIEEETGNKLNSSKLANYFDEETNLFIDSETHDYATHIALIVDKSASMRCSLDVSNRESTAINTACTLAHAIKKAYESNAPVDFSIYAFGDNIEEICNSAENFADKKVKNAYFEARVGGSTNLTRAVNKINELMKEKTTIENVAIVISDAEIDKDEIDSLINSTCADKTKFIFIGVDASEERESFKLFGFNNITKTTEADEIVQNALLNAL